MRHAFVIFMSRTEAITCLPQIITYVRLWRKNGGTKVAPWCKHYSCCSWQKGPSRDKVILIIEEIKSVALAILELCLSEGISL